ncbi:hypothetical protein C8R45DRAFT_292893 [Mycena sanguinolenta]|nr:hypothetical protein C8R45DRAFT_292893 [Mycena sanguinolenta]
MRTRSRAPESLPDQSAPTASYTDASRLLCVRIKARFPFSLHAPTPPAPSFDAGSSSPRIYLRRSPLARSYSYRHRRLGRARFSLRSGASPLYPNAIPCLRLRLSWLPLLLLRPASTQQLRGGISVSHDDLHLLALPLTRHNPSSSGGRRLLTGMTAALVRTEKHASSSLPITRRSTGSRSRRRLSGRLPWLLLPLPLAPRLTRAHSFAAPSTDTLRPHSPPPSRQSRRLQRARTAHPLWSARHAWPAKNCHRCHRVRFRQRQ